ncbi:hypothetical protein GSI_11750 [Ganoderma sinense ZZ0214-1]|uniref:Transporter n=1 Tax=Ganoderma sinense ZZ0214-1 TaxID=1077348 RepID=A0A2G8RWV0_9APHY|nr:hypothetical protein GSI_11750 [Ganoderma sinense ZZ0214-1]
MQSVFLLVTFILGVIDTVKGCHPSESSEGDDTPFVFPGTLFEGLQIGVAACVLSLSTNLLATALVAYKAWESRRRLRGYLIAKAGGSQVEKFLALLVESGAIYSAIWAVVVAYQFAQYKYTNTFTSISTTETGFIDTFGAIMSGALVPVIVRAICADRKAFKFSLHLIGFRPFTLPSSSFW